MTSFALILVYCAFWGYWMWRALKDHAALPYSHYRQAQVAARGAILSLVVAPFAAWRAC